MQPPPKIATTLTASNGGAHVTVRDVDGTVVLDTDLALGQSRTVRVDPPVTVSSDDGGAVSCPSAVRTRVCRAGWVPGDPGLPATPVLRPVRPLSSLRSLLRW